MAFPRRTTEQFKEDVFKKHGDKVEILSEYLGNTEPIDILYHCEKHGDVYKTLNAKNIFGKSFQPCKQCDLELKSIKAKLAVRDKNYQLKRLQDYCESMGGRLISTKWTTAKDTYEVDCGNPDHPIFSSNADSLLNKPQWCPYCSGRNGDFNTKYKDIIESKDGQMLSNYINGKTHIKVKCNKDNYEWSMYPSNIIKGRWCPICSLPYSERVPYDYLIDTYHEYKIIVQYTFDDLKGKTDELLKYDFCFLDLNDNLLGLIEIDDDEHRQNHKQERRVKARERDKIKDQYCLDNNIPLFRLEYHNNKKFKNRDWYYQYIHNNLKDFIHMIININITIVEGD